MIERRALIRHKSFIRGRIYFNNRLSSMDCIVRDVTDNGSRLEVSASVALPDAFEIYLPNKDEYFHARVIWRRGNHVGTRWAAEKDAQHPEHAGSEQAIAERLAKLEHQVGVLQRRLDAMTER